MFAVVKACPFIFCTSLAQLEEGKNEVKSLKAHLRMSREKTSKSIADLVAFIMSEQKKDKLMFPDKDNPFKPKGCCTILWKVSIWFFS